MDHLSSSELVQSVRAQARFRLRFGMLVVAMMLAAVAWGGAARPENQVWEVGGIAGATVGSADFGKLVSDGLQGVQSDWTQAQSSMRALAEGQPVNLHQVMMKMEESRISFQLFLQVRNRLLESYQDVMRMQV